MSRRDVGRLKSIRSKAVVAIVALVLAAISFATAVGEVFVGTNPVLAKEVGFGDRAQANLNYTLILAAVGRLKPTDARILSAAKRAVVVQPLNPKALSAIAMSAYQLGDKPEAVRLATLTQQISRRDVGAQLLLFGDALEKDNSPLAFKQLRTAMRTASERNRTVLFPAITKGLAIPEFRQGLAPIIDEQGEWVPQFMIFAVDQGGASADVARLFLSLAPGTRTFLAPKLSARTITHLTDANQFSAARDLYLSIPGKSANSLMDPGFNARTFDEQMGSLAWMPEEGPNLTARMAQGKQPSSRVVLIDVGPGDSSVALKRILFMPPGTYTFAVSARSDAPSGQISSRWTMRCLAGQPGAVIWDSSNGSAVTIPAGCQAQLMQLTVTQNDSSNYGQLLVDNLVLTRN